MIVRAIVTARSLFPRTTPRARQLASDCYHGYYGEPGYAYGYAPGYAYDSYAYEPAPAYGYGYSYGPAYGTGYAYAPAHTYGGYCYDTPWLDPHRTNNFSISSQR